jgi:hypothetical protein
MPTARDYFLQAQANIVSGLALLPPDSKRTIQQSDLTYLGMMNTPLNARSNGAIALRRRPDGTKSLLVAGEDTSQNPLNEITLAGFSTTAPPSAALLNSWTPAAWQQGCLTWAPIPPASGGLQIGGMCMIDSTLYTVFGGHYDVSGGDKPVLFQTKFNADGTVTSSGPEFVTATNKFCRGWATGDPRGNLYLGAGLAAGDAASSWGRSLISVVPPQILVANGILPSVEMLGYPIGHEDTYPGTHVTSATQTTPVAGGGWINQGYVGTACWVETSSLIGVLYFGHYGDGYVWYGLNPDPASGSYDSVQLSKGYHATEWHGYCAIDNPAKYADVVSGKINPWDPRADSVFDPFPMMGNLPGGNEFTGSCFDADTNTLILSGTWVGTGFLGIHAFKVGT